MPKIKPKKTLLKRVKITKGGKILKKQSRTGHLKVKWSAGKKSRKTKRLTQHNKGHRDAIKKLMGKRGRSIK